MSGETKTGAVKGNERIIEAVRDRYSKLAEHKEVCGCGCAPGGSQSLGYSATDLKVVPEGSDLGLGCGAPVPALGLRPGEVVVDLGSGPGLDVFLAAREVGPAGRVIGVDMTASMLDRARANAARAGITNVEFREGRLEALPVEDASVDAITSNCVINLVPDKRAVFAEIARVLKPGGRIAVSDIVLDGELPRAIKDDILAWVGCVAGAIGRDEYFAQVREAGLTDVAVLRDVDAIGLLLADLPSGIVAAAAESGIKPQDLAGVVRSVTWRAVRK